MSIVVLLTVALLCSLPLCQADVDMKGGSRLRTPLHYAAMSGVVDIAQCLLDAGAREHTQDMLGYVALNLTDKAEMCRLLNTVGVAVWARQLATHQVLWVLQEQP